MAQNETTVGRPPRDRSEWLRLMARVTAIRDGLYFSRRLKFDDELRPKFTDGRRIAYPDAFYHLTEEDVSRAEGAINDR